MQIFFEAQGRIYDQAFLGEAVKLVSLKFASFHTNFINFFTFFSKWVDV